MIKSEITPNFGTQHEIVRTERAFRRIRKPTESKVLANDI